MPTAHDRGLGAVVLLIALSAVSPAGAAALDDARCATLRAERDALVDLGVRRDMLQGPVWAAANLSPSRLARVKQYVVTLEQVLFRCRSIPRVLSDGMDFAENMPAPKPFYERRTFPLPVRKPAFAARPQARPQGLRQRVD